jgi:hypothetical protein
LLDLLGPFARLQGKPRLPAAIADKSREELQVYVVELLKKLKLRDKKLDGAWGAGAGASRLGAPGRCHLLRGSSRHC